MRRTSRLIAAGVAAVALTGGVILVAGPTSASPPKTYTSTATSSILGGVPETIEIVYRELTGLVSTTENQL